MATNPRPAAIHAVDADEITEDGSTEAATRARAESHADAEVSAGTSPAPVAAEKRRRSPVLPVILLAFVAAGGWYGYQWWADGRFMVSTDDAYIQGDIAIISPKVSGYVKAVDVKNNQAVRAGEPLVTLDDGDYRIAAEQARAQLTSQHLTLDRIDAQIGGAEASLAQARAQKLSAEAGLKTAELAHQRASELQAQKFASNATLDTAESSLEQARAAVIGADANIAAAEASIAVLKAQRAEAEAAVRSAELAVEKAQRDLDFTILKAPYDGVVGNLSVQTGDLVSAGKRLAALVPMSDLYIEANFKETQIAHLVAGSKVSIHVDAYGEERFEGTVTSIAPASGSVFSMLPAENATGNFTKIVQRVPVRIALPQDALASGHLRAGLSVVVDVDTRTAPAGTAVAAQ